jgi:Uma2 family endonuclease
MSVMALAYERHRVSLEEYHRMVGAGVFDPDARIELVEGELFERERGMNPAHASAITRTNRLLVTAFGARATVCCQTPVTLPYDSEPMPDFAIVRVDSRDYGDRHPCPEDVHVLIEIADSSRDFDRRKKLPLYARSGIVEAWLVDPVDDRLVAYREPGRTGYAFRLEVGRGESIAPVAFPDIVLAVETLLGPN